jgi:hypothetical protein
VLLVAFNRPDRLRELIASLRPVAPSAIYVAVDGPRPEVPSDAAAVQGTREQVSQIDWDCSVRTLFRDRNLGCGLGVSGAVSWFFDNEERGIVLEDDIRPDPSFFPFCEELLDRFEADDRVWAVSGCNFVPESELADPGASYRFSSVPHIWGWATWRRSWADYQLRADRWWRRLPVADLWRASGRSPWGSLYWASMFEMVSRGMIDTWDVQAVLAAFTGDRVTATANVNLVDNVGFGTDSTHTAARPDYLRPSGSMPLPLAHPSEIRIDRSSDDWTRRNVLGGTASGLARQAFRFAKAKANRA